jgi:hypothetical protein
MNEIVQLRTAQINNFISQFDDLNIVDVDELKEGLKMILGETPAVDFEYETEFALNETTGTEDRKTNLKKIHILYSYIDSNNVPKIGKMSYIVG